MAVVGSSCVADSQLPAAVVVVMLAGQVTVGAWLSLTVTVKLQSAELFPLASVAWQVTVVVPFGKVEPLGGVQVVVDRKSVVQGEAVELCGADCQVRGGVV